jgi:hypothetical protein
MSLDVAAYIPFGRSTSLHSKMAYPASYYVAYTIVIGSAVIALIIILVRIKRGRR